MLLPIENFRKSTESRSASSPKESWAKGEEGSRQWEAWFKEQPQEFQDKWREMNELYGDVVKDQYKKSAESLLPELKENKWTDSDGDNPPPNPKGSDADGDGKTNEPKPFKSAAKSSDFKEGDRVFYWLHGKGTVTNVWNEYGKTGIDIKWDNGDVSSPMDRSRLMADLEKLEGKLELAEGDVVQLRNGDKGTVGRVREVDAWIELPYGASWVPLSSISKVVSEGRRRSAATTYVLFDEGGDAHKGYRGMNSALEAAKKLAVRTNGEVTIQVEGTLDVVGYVQPDGKFDKLASGLIRESMLHRESGVPSKMESMGRMKKLREEHGGWTKAYFEAVLKEVEGGKIAPAAVVGGGYKDGKAVAIKWLTEEMKGAKTASDRPHTAAKAPAKLKGKKLDEAISKAYYKHGDKVQVDIMNIGKIYAAGKAAYEGAESLEEADKALDEAMKAAIAKYRMN